MNVAIEMEMIIINLIEGITNNIAWRKKDSCN